MQIKFRRIGMVGQCAAYSADISSSFFFADAAKHAFVYVFDSVVCCVSIFPNSARAQIFLC